MCHLTQEIDHSELTCNKSSSVDASECICVKVYLQGRILALHVHQLLVYVPLPLHHRIQPFPSPSGIGLAACGWSIYRPRNSWSACLVRDVRYPISKSYHDGLRVMIFSFALYTNVVDKIL
jgi:hypothetical protein